MLRERTHEDSTDIADELGWLRQALAGGETGLTRADLGALVDELAAGEAPRYRPLGPAVVKVAAAAVATFPAAIAPAPAFAGQPLPSNMMLAMSQRPPAAPRAPRETIFTFSRPASPAAVQPVTVVPEPSEVSAAAANAPLNPRLRALLSQPKPVHVTTKRAVSATLYRVGRGDTLYGIARRVLGSGARWREIYAANAAQIGRTYLIRPGQRLTIPQGPPPVALARAGAARTAKAPAVAPERLHRVGRGETLYTIAQQRLGSAKRWKEIVAMNRALQGRTTIYPNQWLVLPKLS